MQQTMKVLQQGIDDHLHPGAQLFVCQSGKVVIDTALGIARADGTPMTTESHTLWMSAGKPLTAIALMQLIESDQTTLDTRAGALIPEFNQNGKNDITLFHLLTHTAGFRGPLNSFAPGPWNDIINRCCQLRQEPNWIPGRKAGYHVASSWFILGEIIQRLDGRPIGRYIREEIFDRIGADCTLGTESTELQPCDALVTPDFAGNQIVDAWTIPRPPANARGPISGLGKVYLSLLNEDGRLLKPQTARNMTHRHRENMFDETFKQTIDWGLGFKLDSKRYGAVEQYGYGSHASDNTYGHSGNQCSCAFADPDHQLVVAWCVNGMPGESLHQIRQHAINTAIYADLGLEK